MAKSSSEMLQEMAQIIGGKEDSKKVLSRAFLSITIKTNQQRDAAIKATYEAYCFFWKKTWFGKGADAPAREMFLLLLNELNEKYFKSDTNLYQAITQELTNTWKFDPGSDSRPKIHNDPTAKFGWKQQPVDLNVWPGVGNFGKSSGWHTIGDLHGNALKLLNFMLMTGAAKLDKADYDAFVKIYNKYGAEWKNLSVEEKRKLIGEFNTLVEKIQISDTAKIRLIGDDLCDRGSNDYFTLKLIDKFKSNKKAKMEVIYSNHTVEYIERHNKKDYYQSVFTPNTSKEKNQYDDGRKAGMGGQTNSLLAMADMIDNGIVEPVNNSV